MAAAAPAGGRAGRAGQAGRRARRVGGRAGRAVGAARRRAARRAAAVAGGRWRRPWQYLRFHACSLALACSQDSETLTAITSRRKSSLQFAASPSASCVVWGLQQCWSVFCGKPCLMCFSSPFFHLRPLFEDLKTMLNSFLGPWKT